MHSSLFADKPVISGSSRVYESKHLNIVSLPASHCVLAIAAMGPRVRNYIVTVDRPLPDRPFLLVRSALLDPKNDIIY